MNIKELKRRLKRQEDIRDKLNTEYHGKEQDHTFYAGFELGYVKGKISEIERTIGDIEVEIICKNK